MTDNRDLARLLAKLYVARPDVKAVQAPSGAYYTHVRSLEETPRVYLPWDMQSMVNHIEGSATYGHYLLSQQNECKVIAFDIDLVKEPMQLPTMPMPPATYESPEVRESVRRWEENWQPRSPREAWLNRADPARDLLKTAMRDLAAVIQGVLIDLELPNTVAYTGAKGLHVYGFMGKGIAATYARQAIEAVVSYLPLKPLRGKNFYTWDNGVQPHETRNLFSIEVFPKQDHIAEGDGFGNLMRLPLGRNLKSNDPTFFVDTKAPMGVLRPVDALTELQRIEEELNA
jgi:hypothetical protein